MPPSAAFFANSRSDTLDMDVFSLVVDFALSDGKRRWRKGRPVRRMRYKGTRLRCVLSCFSGGCVILQNCRAVSGLREDWRVRGWSYLSPRKGHALVIYIVIRLQFVKRGALDKFEERYRAV